MNLGPIRPQVRPRPNLRGPRAPKHVARGWNMEVIVSETGCFGEVIDCFESIRKTIVIFYCYKCRKLHEIKEEEDWLNGLILTRLS
jgi:hypothetical protein